MSIAFRVDASVEIGTGHVMRCITLADMLREKGCTIFFLCKKYEGSLISFLKQKGFVTIALSDSGFHSEEDASEVAEKLSSIHIDALVVDHYKIDIAWERLLRPYVKKICVIDDLANRKHDCDILLDQNFYPNMDEKYKPLVPDNCQLFLGPKYLLLRREFYEITHRESKEVKKILVFFGGSDPTNETVKALEALSNLSLQDVQIDVVVGNSNPRKEEVEEFATNLGANYHCQISYLAQLMEEADLALGAGGVTMWERCFVGLPSIVTIVAENQRASTEAAAHFGAIRLAGRHEEVTRNTYESLLEHYLSNGEELQRMQQKGYELLGKNQSQNLHEHPVVHAILHRSVDE